MLIFLISGLKKCLYSNYESNIWEAFEGLSYNIDYNGPIRSYDNISRKFTKIKCLFLLTPTLHKHLLTRYGCHVRGQICIHSCKCH